MRGKGLGRHLVKKLVDISRTEGCYKVILDCAEKNVGFYEKCGFTRKEVMMALYSKKMAYERTPAQGADGSSVYAFL